MRPSLAECPSSLYPFASALTTSPEARTARFAECPHPRINISSHFNGDSAHTIN